MRELPFAATSDGLTQGRAGDFGGVTAHAAALARGAVAERAQADRSAGEDLRPQVAAVLEALASRTEPALVACLERSREKWDQADSLSILEGDLADEISALRRHLAEAAQLASSPARRAIALEGMVVLDTSVALVRLFERRLAPLLRLRLRSPTPDFLPGGRPFLDLGEALHELAEAWR